MIVFLKKVRIKSVFSIFEPVITEPLELCCLKAVLDEICIENYIADSLFGLKEPEGKVPDAVVLTGYNVAENEILNEAARLKSMYPGTKIIVGGVHVQINPQAFHSEHIDFVFRTGRLDAFRCLIERIADSSPGFVDGVDFKLKDAHENEVWHEGNVTVSHEAECIYPDRTLFNRFRHHMRYLDKKNVALIKGSIGCPYGCSYCFCKLLNSGNYVKPDYRSMVAEMESIDADYFWIVDDVLFTSRNDAVEFIDTIKKSTRKFKIIGYLRADFILREKDMLPVLRDAGLEEIIVGFESSSNDELKEYSKTTNALNYPDVISLLRESNIDLTALFMVQPDYKANDFFNLYKFIKNNNIDVYTISILTPIKGTVDYEALESSLLTKNPEKFDFLHLVMKPLLPKPLFYLLFYSIHIRLLKSKRIRKYLISLLRGLSGEQENL